MTWIRIGTEFIHLEITTTTDYNHWEHLMHSFRCLLRRSFFLMCFYVLLGAPPALICRLTSRSVSSSFSVLYPNRPAWEARLWSTRKVAHVTQIQLLTLYPRKLVPYKRLEHVTIFSLQQLSLNRPRPRRRWDYNIKTVFPKMLR
jgi:hypothetical protein